MGGSGVSEPNGTLSEPVRLFEKGLQQNGHPVGDGGSPSISPVEPMGLIHFDGMCGRVVIWTRR